MKKSMLLALMLAGCSGAPVAEPVQNPHAAMLTLDTHLDTPMHFGLAGWSFADRHELTTDLVQVDMPRIADGNLDGGFFAIYPAQCPLTPAGSADAPKFPLGLSAFCASTLTLFPPRFFPL